MIKIRKSHERGHYDYGWLNTHHTFSFNTYYDEKHMSFRTLRVINQDNVAAGQGFGTHPHKDMEIITYIVDGILTHADSTGTKSSIKRGDVQVMTAGSGVLHSEFNDSKKPVHLLQIWIVPSKKNLPPKYEEKHFRLEKNKLNLIVSNDSRDESLKINQDVLLYSIILEKNKEIKYILKDERGCWLQLISGELMLRDLLLKPGDGVSIDKENHIGLKATMDSEFLLFDLV